MNPMVINARRLASSDFSEYTIDELSEIVLCALVARDRALIAYHERRKSTPAPGSHEEESE